MLGNSQVKPAGVDRQARRALHGQTARRHAAKAAAVLRRHWLAAALLAAGLVLRVLAQLAYRPALFYIDTARYLYNADGNDPVGYKGPLRAILLVANFDAVAAIQHLLGLAMAVVIYLLLLRRGAPRWLAALAIAPVLLDAYQLQIEQTIMPDTLFEALIVAGLAILLWQPRTSWRHAIGQAALLCAAFALPILAYCAGSYLLTGDFFLSHTGVTSAYGRMASAADCATLRLPTGERGMCPAKIQQAQGPDWLEYAPGSPILPYYVRLPRADVDRLLSDFNHRVLAQQPLRVLAAYRHDVLKLFALTRTGSPGDTPISRWQFQTTYPYYTSQTTMPVVKTAADRFGGGVPTAWRPVAAFLRSYQLGGGYTPGPLLAVFTLAGLAGSAALLRRRAEPGTRQLALACLLFFTSAVSVTLISDLFEFSWRYQLPALVTLAPAGALGISVIIGSIRSQRSSCRKTSGAALPECRDVLHRDGMQGEDVA